jgi:hypothetical protein
MAGHFAGTGTLAEKPMLTLSMVVKPGRSDEYPAAD